MFRGKVAATWGITDRAAGLRESLVRAGSRDAPAPFTTLPASQGLRSYGTTSTILRVVGSTSTGVLSTIVYR